MANYCTRDRTCYLINGHEGDHLYLPYPSKVELELMNSEYETVKDKQVGGDHYKGGTMQPWDIWEAFGLDPWEASAVKYILRWRKKGGVEDLEKAKHYIDFLIEKENNK